MLTEQCTALQHISILLIFCFTCIRCLIVFLDGKYLLSAESTRSCSGHDGTAENGLNTKTSQPQQCNTTISPIATLRMHLHSSRSALPLHTPAFEVVCVRSIAIRMRMQGHEYVRVPHLSRARNQQKTSNPIAKFCRATEF